jgi:tetratricopeptide (TPR) repeat protein
MTTGSEFASAVALFKHAIEIDPQFAMAHASLGFTYMFMGQPTLSAEAVRKAYELRDRVSDRERFFISANYELQVTGNLERTLEICESWARSYPRDIQPYGILGAMLYPTYGRFDKGVEAANHLVEIDPDFVIGYLQLEFNHQFAGRLRQAEDALGRAAQRKLEIPELAVQRYDVAFVKGDRAAMDREVALAGKPEGGDLVPGREGFVLAYSGRLQEAEARARQTADQAQPTVQPGRAALWRVGPALWNGFFGNSAAAIKNATAALDLSKDRDVAYGAGFALALAGDTLRAETVAGELSQRFPDDSSVKFTYVPTIRALLALNRHDPMKALDLLKPTVPYELGTPLCTAPTFFGILYPVYVRGLAYLAAQRGANAAAEFQKILDRPFLVVSDPIRALARLQLGRALAQSRDTVKARAAYEEFLMLWKEADPNLPILQQAKSEYAKLQ